MPTPVNSVDEASVGITGCTGTAFVGSPATQYCVQIGGSTSSTLANVTNGTNGQVLTANTGAAPTFQNASSGGYPNWTLITNTPISGTPSTITFNSGITTYKRVMIEFVNVVCSTQTAQWLMKISADGGTTPLNGSLAMMEPGTVVVFNASTIPISASGGSTPGTAGVNGTIIFDNPNVTSIKTGLVTLFTTTTTTRIAVGSFSTTLQAAQINYIQLSGSGTFNSGTINLYGM